MRARVRACAESGGGSGVWVGGVAKNGLGRGVAGGGGKREGGGVLHAIPVGAAEPALPIFSAMCHQLIRMSKKLQIIVAAHAPDVATSALDAATPEKARYVRE